MLWAAFTLAFFGFLRCSEFTSNSPFDATYHLSRTDIIFQPNILHAESYDVVIKGSKTDLFRRGCRLTIGSYHNKLCPVRAMKTYLLQSPSEQTLHPLFKFKSGDLLTRTALDCYERYIQTPKEVLVSVPFKITASNH